jgi:hypothetical protein
MARSILLLWAAAAALHAGGARGSPAPPPATAATGAGRAGPAAATLSVPLRAHRRRGAGSGFDGAAERRRILLKHGLPLPPEPPPPRPRPLGKRGPATDDPTARSGPADGESVTPPGGGQAVQGSQAAPEVGLYGTARAISDMNDVEYLVDMLVGNTEMRLDLDTGSSNLYVFFPSSLSSSSFWRMMGHGNEKAKTLIDPAGCSRTV